jgi:hypothetical protein
LSPHGIDLVHPFAVGWFNRAVEPAEALAAFDRTGALGVLIGNTHRMWEPFLAACRADPTLRVCPDPIEGYRREPRDAGDRRSGRAQLSSAGRMIRRRACRSSDSRP